MSQSARVTSIAALRQLKQALCRFEAEAVEALGATDMEIRRGFDWLQDQLERWQREVRRREQLLNEARLELNHRKFARMLGDKPDCTEQEEAVRKAQQALRLAEAKVAAVKQWHTRIIRLVSDYQGIARQMQGAIEIELRNAIAFLEQKGGALEAYVQTLPPEGPAVDGSPAAETGSDVPAAATSAQTNDVPVGNSLAKSQEAHER